MYKILIIMTCLVSISSTKMMSIQPNSKILNYSNTNDGSGLYSYSFTTSDNIERKEHSSFDLSKSKTKILRVTGSYSYIGPDGVLYDVQYVADENGFQPIGKHLPIYYSEEKNVYTESLLKSAFSQISNINGEEAVIPKDNFNPPIFNPK